MGLSNESDCIVVIVSEETGVVSIAIEGQLQSPIPRDRLTAVLTQILEVEEAAQGEQVAPTTADKVEAP